MSRATFNSKALDWILVAILCLSFGDLLLKKSQSLKWIENPKYNKMIDTLGQAWQNGSALAAQTPGITAVNKHRLFGSLIKH